ncbi:MAG TPA: hypothetical protein VLZ11_08340 [Flavobacterium sp.]|nr:hypothetical protein [Flavobacterium sp.]
MKLIAVMTLIFPFLFNLSISAQEMDIAYLRVNYEKAVSDKDTCQRLLAKLSENTPTASHLAYLGAFQTIWAKHSNNPITKLTSFNRGKKNIENAIKLGPDSIEIRFIRLSIQKKAPGFLGYKNNIEEDTKFIKTNREKITSEVLKQMIDSLLN